MTGPEAEAPHIVGEALARAVAGDTVGGGQMLAPLIAAGPRSAYALAAMLAEAASHIARRDNPGALFGISAEHVATGAPGSVDAFPPDVVFAAQFVTAWANRDQDMATALFNTLVARSATDDGAALVEGLLSLFRLAVTTAAAVCAEARTDRTGKDQTP